MAATGSNMEAIKAHLKSLGYDDVPEDVLAELAEELESNGFVAETITSQTTASSRAPPSKPNIVTSESAISRRDLIEQLKLLGYDEESIPADVLDELAKELSETVGFSSSSNFLLNSVTVPVESANQEEVATNTEEEEARIPRQLFIDTSVQESAYQSNNDISDHRHIDPRHIDPHHIDQYQQPPQISNINNNSWLKHEETRNAVARQLLNIPFRVGVMKQRKTDPLVLYQRFKTQWARDSFLQRRSDPSSSKAKERMFGGIGYHALMGGNQVSTMPGYRRPSTSSSSSFTHASIQR